MVGGFDAVEYTELKSSNVFAVAYDPLTRRMELVMKGGTYRYYQVPLEVYLGLLIAPSAGKYVNERIAHVYAYRQGAG